MANPKKLINALGLVENLAEQNALDPDEEPELKKEAARQGKALGIVLNLIEEMKKGNVPIAAEVLERIQNFTE